MAACVARLAFTLGELDALHRLFELLAQELEGSLSVFLSSLVLGGSPGFECSSGQGKRDGWGRHH